MKRFYCEVWMPGPRGSWAHKVRTRVRYLTMVVDAPDAAAATRFFKAVSRTVGAGRGRMIRRVRGSDYYEGREIYTVTPDVEDTIRQAEAVWVAKVNRAVAARGRAEYRSLMAEASEADRMIAVVGKEVALEARA